MITRGNLVASYRKDELKRMESCLTQLTSASSRSIQALDPLISPAMESNQELDANMTQAESAPSQTSFEPLREWNSEDGLSGEQLTALADSLNFDDLGWLTFDAPFDPIVDGMQIEHCPM